MAPHVLIIIQPAREARGLFIAAKCVKSQNHPPFYTMKSQGLANSQGPNRGQTKKPLDYTCSKGGPLWKMRNIKVQDTESIH